MCCVQSVPAGTGGHFPLTVLPQRCLSFLSQALSWTLFYLSLYSLLILSSQIQHRAISPLHMNTKQSRVCVCVWGGIKLVWSGGRGKGKGAKANSPFLHFFIPSSQHEGVRLQLQSTHSANSSSFITNTVLWKSFCLLLHFLVFV